MLKKGRSYSSAMFIYSPCLCCKYKRPLVFMRLPGPAPLHLPHRSWARFPGCPPTRRGAPTHGTPPPSGPCASSSRSRGTGPASTLRGAREQVTSHTLQTVKVDSEQKNTLFLLSVHEIDNVSGKWWCTHRNTRKWLKNVTLYIFCCQMNTKHHSK